LRVRKSKPWPGGWAFRKRPNSPKYSDAPCPSRPSSVSIEAVAVAGLDAAGEEQAAVDLLQLLQGHGLQAGAGRGPGQPGQPFLHALAQAALVGVLPLDRGHDLRLDAAVLLSQVASSRPGAQVQGLDQVLAETGPEVGERGGGHAQQVRCAPGRSGISVGHARSSSALRECPL